MAVATINPPANFAQALQTLAGKRSKKLGHNTLLELAGHGTNVVITYHGNTIATYSPMGLVVTLAP